MTWKELKEKIETFDEKTLNSKIKYYDDQLDEPILITGIEESEIGIILMGDL